MSLGELPPACPEDWTEVIAFPSVCATFAILAITSLAFATLTTCKYNSVNLWSKSVHSDIISNTPWIAYFLSVCLRSSLISLEYAFESGTTPAVVFNGCALLSRGVVVFCLTFALHHQRRFRSSSESASLDTYDRSDSPMTLSATVGGYVSNPSTRKPLARALQSLKPYVGILEAIYATFLLCYVILGVIVLLIRNDITETIFLTMYCLQQIPALVLVVLIILEKSNRNKQGQEKRLSPSAKSKIFLALGGICACIDELPITGWGRVLPESCTFYVASLNDVVHLVYGLSLCFFFLFLRSEYCRNVDQCIWKTVGRMQDRIDSLE